MVFFRSVLEAEGAAKNLQKKLGKRETARNEGREGGREGGREEGKAREGKGEEQTGDRDDLLDFFGLDLEFHFFRASLGWASGVISF